MTHTASKGFSHESIEDLKSRINAVEVIGDYVKIKQTGASHVALCPFHDDHNPSLGVTEKGYHCFACDESGDAIKFVMEYQKVSFPEAIALLADKYNVPLQGSFSNHRIVNLSSNLPARKPPKNKIEPTPPLPPTGNLELVRLAEVPADIPQQSNFFDEKRGEVIRTNYVYSSDGQGNIRWVTREEWEDSASKKGKSKKFCQWHRAAPGEQVPKWIDGKKTTIDAAGGENSPTKGDAPWEAYRFSEALISAKNYECPILLAPLEGEKNVEIARQHRIASFSFQGSSWNDAEIIDAIARLKTECLDGIALAFLVDNDAPGKKKAKRFVDACTPLDIFAVAIDVDSICPELADVPGADIEQVLEKMSAEEFIARLEVEIHKAVATRRIEAEAEAKANNKSGTGHPPGGSGSEDWRHDNNPDRNVEELITQIAFNQLYSDKPWISIQGRLHYWEGSFYEEVSDDVEIARISGFLNSYVVTKVKGDAVFLKYEYATACWSKNILAWVKARLGKDPNEINPPGLNLSNGVLEISWNGDEPTWELIPHSQNKLYTYCSKAEYNPDADSQWCNAVLQSLDSAEQDIFLKVIGASLDLKTVRSKRGRLVKGLLAQGTGNNGKDTLRECVSGMYGGHGMTGKTTSDFAAYDLGRKFPLANLIHSRANWASENSDIHALDKLQSLKRFITGDPLDAERKGVDEVSFIPCAIGIFNINDVPNLAASQEAIQSRYAILSFSKKFVIGADTSKGEIEADSRFKYDPEFLEREVLPAFLNKVLDAFKRLMTEGIDYRCTDAKLRETQATNNHLFQFCQDTGFGYQREGKVYINDVWVRLRQWYIDNGTLEVETVKLSNGTTKEKLIWHDQANKRDRNIKALNQVAGTFIRLFPDAKKGRDNSGNFLIGIGFSGGVLQSCCNSAAMGVAVSHTQQQSAAVEAVLDENYSDSKKEISEKEILDFLLSHASACERILSALGVDAVSENLDQSGSESKSAPTATSPLPASVTATPTAAPVQHQCSTEQSDEEKPQQLSLELQFDNFKFKEKDRVRVIDKEDSLYGEVGVIVRVDRDDDSCEYNVQCEKSFTWYGARQLEKAEDNGGDDSPPDAPPPPPEPEEFTPEGLGLSADDDDDWESEEADRVPLSASLTADQEAALAKLQEFILNSALQYFRLTGYAGTGKSFLISQLMLWLQSENITFAAASPTNKASKNLARLAASVGLHSAEVTTVAKLLGLQPELNAENGKEEFIAGLDQEPKLSNYNVVIIDEFSMVSKSNFGEINSSIQGTESKVIFVGDAAQLPPVGEKEPIVANHPLITESASLTEIVRYDGELATVAEAIRTSSKYSKLIYPFCTSDDGSINCLPRQEWLNEAAKIFKSESYQENPDHCRIIVWRNNTAAKINDWVRIQLWGEDAADYIVGDHLIAKRPVFRQTVTSIKGRKKEWTILLNNSDECEVVGDAKLVTDKRGWQYWLVPVVTDSGNTIKLQLLTPASEKLRATEIKRLNDEKKWWDSSDLSKEYDECPYAYAITTHKSQGSSINNVFIDIADMRGCPDLQQMQYTAVTRTKVKAYIPN
jgi:putative DNA primase/helicase